MVPPGSGAPVVRSCSCTRNRDDSASFSESEKGYRGSSRPKYLVELVLPFSAVAHVLPFLPGRRFPLADQVAAVTDAFLGAYLGGDGGPAAIRRAAAGSDQIVLHARP